MPFQLTPAAGSHRMGHTPAELAGFNDTKDLTLDMRALAAEQKDPCPKKGPNVTAIGL